MRAKLDKMDVRLLNAIQSNNQLSAEILAEAVPLSPSAIMRRLRRLRTDGVIAYEAAVLSRDVLHGRLSAFINVQLERHQTAATRKLLSGLLKSPEIQLCAEVTGSVDILLLVTVRSMDDLNRLTQDLLESNPAVHRYEISFAKTLHKRTFAVPLEDADCIVG
jgi:Lrp/AsnC family transcriptional regulator, leucine-responsive regulatory protein